MLSFFLLFSKESELIELRETIEMLKAQNSAAQAAIQGALNGPDHTHRGIMFCLFFPVENGFVHQGSARLLNFHLEEHRLCHIIRYPNLNASCVYSVVKTPMYGLYVTVFQGSLSDFC